MNETLKRIQARQEKMDALYSPLKGLRVTTFNQEWSFSRTNDIGVPYFQKVVKGNIQKTEFTLSDYKKDWLDAQLNAS